MPPSGAHVTRTSRGLAAFLAYLLGAVLLTVRAWRDPAHGWAGNCCDQQQTIWYLGWTPHALANGLDPFFTTQIGAPTGVNLMWNTPMTLLGLLGWLPAKIGGPILGFNVLMVLGIALSGFTAWLAIRRYTGDGAGAMVGGAVYAFSPYIASHAALHLNLATAWVPPLFLLALDDLLNTRRRPPWQSGVALGILSAAQLYITEEMLAASVLAAAVFVGVMALVHRDGRTRQAAPGLAAALGVATLTFLTLTAYPLAVQFFGPQRINDQVQDPKLFSTDLLNLVLPTPYQLIAPDAATHVSEKFSGLYHEATGYLGVPLIVLIVVAAIRQWGDQRVRIATITGALILLLSLGPELHVGNNALHIPLPWLIFSKLPLLKHLLPGRFTLFVWLAVAVVIAITVQRAISLTPRKRAQWLLATAVALVLVLPAPLEHHRSYTPLFFRTWASHGIRPDETVLVAPYFLDAGGQAAPMLWAADADYGLRMPEAYAYMPQPGGRTRTGPPPTRLAQIMLMIQDDKIPVLARGEVRAQVAADLHNADVRHVIVGPMQEWPAMFAFFTDLFGRDAQRVDEIGIWRDVNVWSVVAAPDEPR
ncbi:hypothetical protein [Mycobacterium asiaticum]|uniref:hypothetical protein n=1 Tax=Mycobacterium asiaticum TaxID=1790 RepID=UPI0007EFFDC8|nr:hypothetical protein [Mycobacterium asiaticum]OBJ58509.1 hypothetical protein A9W94_16290 [Mycobacterium asiaticum]